MTRLADPQQASLRLPRPLQHIDHALVLAQPTLLAAIKLCISAAGFERDKQVCGELEIDAGHWSRILTGQAHFPVDKLPALMDFCGNEAPLLWLVHNRKYDLTQLRRRETEYERENRELREQVAQMERDREVELRLLRELKS